MHLRLFPKAEKNWGKKDIGDKWKAIISLRKVVTSAIEIQREKKIIGSSLEASTELKVSEKINKYLNNVNLNDLLIVSSAKIVNKLSGETFTLEDVKDIHVKIKKADGEKSERCWVISPDVKNNQNLCNRCKKVVQNEQD